MIQNSLSTRALTMVFSALAAGKMSYQAEDIIAGVQTSKTIDQAALAQLDQGTVRRSLRDGRTGHSFAWPSRLGLKEEGDVDALLLARVGGDSAFSYEALVDAVCYADGLDGYGFSFLRRMQGDRDERSRAVADYIEKAWGTEERNRRPPATVPSDSSRVLDKGRGALFCPTRVSAGSPLSTRAWAVIDVLYALERGEATVNIDDDWFRDDVEKVYAGIRAGDANGFLSDNREVSPGATISRKRFGERFQGDIGRIGCAEAVRRIAEGLAEGMFLPVGLVATFDEYYSKGEGEEEAVNVFKGVYKALVTECIPPSEYDKEPERPGLFSIPSLRGEVDTRDDLVQNLRERLDGVPENDSMVFLVGDGGVGKTVLASLCARRWLSPSISIPKESDTKRVVWAAFEGSWETTLQAIGVRIANYGGDDVPSPNPASALDFLEGKPGQRTLLVVDNVYVPTKTAEELLSGDLYAEISKKSRLTTLVTTRYELDEVSDGYNVVLVPCVDEERAFNLFMIRARVDLTGERETFKSLYRRLGGNSLVLSVAAGSFRRGRDHGRWETLADFLRGIDGWLARKSDDVVVEQIRDGVVERRVDSPSGWVRALLGVDGLTDEERAVLACCLLLPPDGAPIKLMRQVLAGGGPDVEGAFDSLLNRRLLVHEEVEHWLQVRLHDLVADAIAKEDGCGVLLSKFVDGLWVESQARNANLETMALVEYVHSELLGCGHGYASREAFSQGKSLRKGDLHLAARVAVLLETLGRTREACFVRRALSLALGDDKVGRSDQGVDWAALCDVVFGDISEHLRKDGALRVMPKEWVMAQVLVDLAAEEGRCGQYETAVGKADEALEGLESSTIMAAPKRLLLARALRTRGYTRYDWSERFGGGERERAREASLTDKRKALRLLDDEISSIDKSTKRLTGGAETYSRAVRLERAGLLVTLAYSESGAGRHEDALGHVEEACAALEGMLNDGWYTEGSRERRHLEESYATALYQYGLFESSYAAGLRRVGKPDLAGRLEESALGHKVSGLERRMKILSPTHMDVARAWLQVGLSLARLGRGESAGLCLQRAKKILDEHTTTPKRTQEMRDDLEGSLKRIDRDAGDKDGDKYWLETLKSVDDAR